MFGNFCVLSLKCEKANRKLSVVVHVSNLFLLVFGQCLLLPEYDRFPILSSRLEPRGRPEDDVNIKMNRNQQLPCWNCRVSFWKPFATQGKLASRWHEVLPCDQSASVSHLQKRGRTIWAGKFIFIWLLNLDHFISVKWICHNLSDWTGWRQDWRFLSQLDGSDITKRVGCQIWLDISNRQFHGQQKLQDRYISRAVAEWSKAPVCRTGDRGFDSHWDSLIPNFRFYHWTETAPAWWLGSEFVPPRVGRVVKILWNSCTNVLPVNMLVLFMYCVL